jgi:hypothetical protein
VYADGRSDGGKIEGVEFTNNHLGTGQWGYSSFAGNRPVWSGNVLDGHALAKALP